MSICFIIGGENDLLVCNFGCFIVEVVINKYIEMKIVMIYCLDRFFCGGDYWLFLEVGYSVVCFIELNENFDY